MARADADTMQRVPHRRPPVEMKLKRQSLGERSSDPPRTMKVLVVMMTMMMTMPSMTPMTTVAANHFCS